MSVPKCDYCQKDSERATGAEIYPHRPDLFAKTFYRCLHCRAHVGCHPGTDRPLGRLANQSLRKAKQKAHAAFDPIWKTKIMKRPHAYAWLAVMLGIEGKDCHIGMFSEAQCRRVAEVCEELTTKDLMPQGPGEPDEPGQMWTDEFW